MNIVTYMLILFALLTVIAVVKKLLSEKPEETKAPARSNSDRLDEIAARLEKIEAAIASRQE